MPRGSSALHLGRLMGTSRQPSRIWLRLLAFNLLLLFLPLAGILYLDVYESRLLEAQERTMVQQARLVAAALGQGGTVDRGAAQQLFERLGQRDDGRLRVYDGTGTAIADSARVRYDKEREGAATAYAQAPSSAARDTLLYRAGALAARGRAVLGRWGRRLLLVDRRPRPESPATVDAIPPEVKAALEGRYRAATRPTPGQRSLTLTSAVPIRAGDSIVGAVAVSQSTFRVLSTLYDVRLRIFQIVIASIAAGALLTALAAATIVRPLTRLRREATALADRRAPLPGTFADAARRDEMGELARALRELTRRLDDHIRTVERFASDVSHEFKNPLASIRTAAEMAMHAEAAADRERFLTLLVRDADRLERMVTDVRELARIDTELAREPVEIVEMHELVIRVVDGLRFARGSEPQIAVAADRGPLAVRGAADRLAQAVENVVANAQSLAPPQSSVDVAIARDGPWIRLQVLDRGPGIPDTHLERVFERFFSYRPGEPDARAHHAGLGLAIARTIVEGYGGSIAARNRDGGGACFEIRLPAAAPLRPSA